jgi:CRP-like cAMP-binding protein
VAGKKKGKYAPGKIITLDEIDNQAREEMKIISSKESKKKSKTSTVKSSSLSKKSNIKRSTVKEMESISNSDFNPGSSSNSDNQKEEDKENDKKEHHEDQNKKDKRRTSTVFRGYDEEDQAKKFDEVQRDRSRSTRQIVAKKIFINDEREDEVFDEDVEEKDIVSMASTGDLTPSKVKVRNKRKRKCCANPIRGKENIPRYLILPNDVPKQIWDTYMTFLVIFISFVVPYRVAFITEDEGISNWDITMIIIDSCFAVDIVLNFFTAYINDNKEYVLDRKLIIRHYLLTWFFLDVVSCIPFNLILDVNNYNSLARVSRLPRLYKVIRIIRLTRMLKIAKEKSKLSKYLNEVLSFSIGFERFVFFLAFMVIFVHLAAWFYFFIGSIESDERDAWYFTRNLQDDSNFDLYITCLYFVFTTITTVGFGDISGGTNSERIFCAFLMIFGVLAFSFTTSSLSTLITNMDSRNAKLKTRLAQLNSLNSKYNLNLRLYHKLEKVLKFDHSKHEQFEVGFLNDIPQRLRVELSLHMYQKYIKKLPFLQEKNGHFIAFVCPMLVPQFVPEKEIIYKEGDPVNEVYFLLSGKVGMVLNVESKQHVFMYIEEGHYFGEIDLLSQSIISKGSNKSNSLDNKRKFTTVAMVNWELLLWSKKNMYLADSEFHDVIKSIFSTAERRLKKATDAKKSAAAYYNSLIKKTQNTVFHPFVTRAQSEAEPNIFHARKENLHDEENNTIIEEYEEEDQTFDKLQKSNKKDLMEVGEDSKIEDSKLEESNLTPAKSKRLLNKSQSALTPKAQENDEIWSNATHKPRRLLSSLKKNKDPLSRTLKKKLSDTFLKNLNEEKVQNVHFMQIKSISANFTPEMRLKIKEQGYKLESEDESEDEEKKELEMRLDQLEKIRKVELASKDKTIKELREQLEECNQMIQKMAGLYLKEESDQE